LARSGPSTRMKADLQLGDRIETIHRQSRLTYGRPQIKAELQAEGIRVSNDRIARLMRNANCMGPAAVRAFAQRLVIVMLTTGAGSG
jgi:transposase InsO family protein